jgi:hypothetical protein
MHTRRLRPVITLAALLALTACESSKSSNHLSPSVAGPIPGVEISAPKLLEPGAGWTVEAANQPLTLLIENASSNGVRPLSYMVEVALDSGFSNKVFSKASIASGEGGRTSLRLPEPLASEDTYYWRARAEDGANTGPFSAAANFVVYTPIVLGTPGMQSPPLNSRISSRIPTFVIQNAQRGGPVGPITYHFQVATDPGFGNVVAQFEVPEGLPQTSRTLDRELAYDTYYYWRARAFEGNKSTTGPWNFSAFTTVAAPIVTPPTPPSPGGGTPGHFRNGPEIVEYIAATYPERLVTTATLDERLNNLMFLRDRIIEAGICSGMDLAWNRKWGGAGDRSIDALIWRHDGLDDVIDFAYASKANWETLRLQWIAVGGSPTYEAYSPRPSCR